MVDDADFIVLPETKLRFDRVELVRFDEKDEPIMKIPADSIRSVAYSFGVSPFGIVLVAAAAVIAVIGYELEDNTFATVLMYLISVLGGSFGLLSIKQNRLAIKTDSDNLVVDASDTKDVIKGFAATLNRQLTKR